MSEDLDASFELEETKGSQRGNVNSTVDFQDESYSSFNADRKWRERNKGGKKGVRCSRR